MAFDWYQNQWPWMALNGVMTLILRCFTEIGSFRGALRKSVRVRCPREKVHVRYLISWWVSCFPDLVVIRIQISATRQPWNCRVIWRGECAIIKRWGRCALAHTTVLLRRHCHMQRPHACSDFHRYSFAVSAPAAWNNIPAAAVILPAYRHF